MAMQCSLCGHESTAAWPRAMYSCKAPNCPKHAQPICYNCLIKLGARDVMGSLENCPFCGLGELQYLGNR